jgi:hypothetical protein
MDDASFGRRGGGAGVGMEATVAGLGAEGIVAEPAAGGGVGRYLADFIDLN